MTKAGQRDFLCRHHLWHSWEKKRVRTAPFDGSSVIVAMWVCRRCKMGAPMIYGRKRLPWYISRYDRSSI